MTLAMLGVMPYLERFRQERSFGVLTLLFVLFVLAAWLTRRAVVQRLDERMTLGLQHRRSPGLDRLMRGMTILGDPAALGVVAALGALFLWATGRREAAVLTLLALVGLPLNFAIKELIRRPRPDLAIVKVLLPVTGRSFPSGHAMTATMLYGFLGLLIWVHAHPAGVRSAATCVMGLIPLGVGLSRIYLGVHWFSDVIGGWAAGVFFLLVMAVLYGLIGGGQLLPWG